MSFAFTIVALVVVLAISWRFLGSYMAAVFEGRVKWLAFVERPLYRVIGVDAENEQSWQRYAGSVIIFSGLALLVTYGIFRLQGSLPFNPQHLGAVGPALAWNTAVSFVTNTNWQAYSSETTMSYLSQMGSLAVQNFVSAAVGIAVAIALIRGFSRHGAKTIGNFWVDLVRATIYVLLPIAFVAAIIFISEGALQTLAGPVHITDALNGASQVVPRGPIASQEVIKQLGTNGGGFFNANGADPFENPTGLTNFLSIALILCIPVSLTYTFGVYVVVMVPVARVVASMDTARTKELRQGRELRELFELSDLLVEDKPLEALLPALVTALSEVFGARQVALFLPARSPAGDHMQMAAAAGEPLSEAQPHAVLPAPGAPASIGGHPADRYALRVIALLASSRPVGLLALSADAAARHQREPLLLFVNQIALAVERAQLREQVLRTRVDAEMARVAKTLVAAVAHDLRAPLASLKASSSTLADPELEIGAGARRSLATTIDAKADHLADLVQNLLDMSRVQAGVLRPRQSVFSVEAFVSGVLSDIPPSWHGYEIRTEIPDGMPPIDADLVLMTRVLTNLIDNAVRHSPAGAAVTVRAALSPGRRAVLLYVARSGGDSRGATACREFSSLTTTAT